MSIISELSYICKELRLIGDDKLANEAIFAYAAISGEDNPRPDLSYSYIMRKLRKGDKDRRLKFQKSFKQAFDEALLDDVEEPAELALVVAMKAIDFKDE